MMPTISNPPKRAVIREDECIGCTKCIAACPFDSIIGASKLMHTVISDVCTGCELCVEPCPVDCIDIVDVIRTSTSNFFEQKSLIRFEKHSTRVAQERIKDREAYLQAKSAGTKNKSLEERKAEIARILKRT